MALKNFGLVANLEQLEAFVERLIKAGQPIGFDIETGYDGDVRDAVSLHPDDPDCKIVGISFTNSTDWARYVPLGHDLAQNFDPVPTAKLFWQLLQTGLGVAHNVKFELRHLARWFRENLSDDPEVGEAVRASRGYYPFLSDTMIEAYMLAEWQKVGLKPLSKAVFDYDQAELISLFPGLAKNKSKAIRFNILELTPEVVGYACDDSVRALMLHEKNYPRVKDMLLFKVEIGIVPVLCDMEDYGVKYDWQTMREKAAEGRVFLEEMNAEIQADLSAKVGEAVSVNLGSPKQISDMLYGRLGMATSVKTKTGAMSTGAIALEALSRQYPVVRKILDWKEMRVLLTRYLEKYEKDYGYALDGMTHPNHMQTAVGTGRFAVSDPPYQQTPKKYHFELNNGKVFELSFRNLIMAPPDHYILGFDFSQVELRMMAGEAGEPTLLHAFDNDEDVHTATAALMLGKPKEGITKEERAIGKTMNFALLYGMGPKSLATRLAISKDEGQRLYDQYFAAYSAIGTWVDRQTQLGKKRGYTVSKFGRRFTIWEFQSQDSWIYSKGERLCVNAPIQGAAADYMKIAMFRQRAAIKEAGLADKVHLVMNIHDALEYYVHKDVKPEDVIRALAPAVTYPVQGLPKIVADWHIGQRWGELTELEWTGTELRRKDGVRLEQEAPAIEVDDEGGSREYLPEVDLEALRAVATGRTKEAYDVKSYSEVASHAAATLAPTAPPEKDKYAPDNGVAVSDHQRAANALSQVFQQDRFAKAQELELRMDVQPPYPEQGRTVEVLIKQMPMEDDYLRWVAWLNHNRGPHKVVLKTPEGDLEYDTTSKIGPEDQAQVSVLLGGATVRYAVDSVDTSALAAGLAL